MTELAVGDKVRAKEAIYEPADDYAPGGYLCGKGDTLVVRRVDGSHVYPIKVSHEHVTDCSFGVDGCEIERIAAQAQTEGGKVGDAPSEGGKDDRG